MHILPLWLLTTLRRKLFEYAGSDRFSKPAYQGIQARLNNYFEKPGFFIEAGAVDGFFESNTYYLERFCNWKGILIEPVPHMYKRLAVNRSKTKRFNCALVPPDYTVPTVPITVNHAISTVIIRDDFKVTNGKPVIDVPARTLTSVLDEVKPPQIDLLSLDVEGFEIAALQGLDFEKYKPDYILVECLNEQAKNAISTYLGEHYTMIEQFSYRDYFFQANTLSGR
ncbi:hypothetical protein CKO42_02930 [Lamprobacter modestohalophilus]|uniref:Methyltransferase FkbM domain-containing protein n=1 Tax=Lamprobacter modestohalophilus TaxID=1064514 RepID=A0A9X0W602_9GAMM|nr:FkbM family methyltransferase [Lamprobacter modestohalophilus]MBK1617426.1 hypothetical protein [Lamprobacter modestohalophilus]